MCHVKTVKNFVPASKIRGITKDITSDILKDIELNFYPLATRTVLFEPKALFKAYPGNSLRFLEIKIKSRKRKK